MIKTYYRIKSEQQQQQLLLSLAKPFHTQQHDLQSMLCFSVVSLLSLSRQTIAVIILYIETIATLAKLNILYISNKTLYIYRRPYLLIINSSSIIISSIVIK
jgi:hypothetical protein